MDRVQRRGFPRTITADSFLTSPMQILDIQSETTAEYVHVVLELSFVNDVLAYRVQLCVTSLLIHNGPLYADIAPWNTPYPGKLDFEVRVRIYSIGRLHLPEVGSVDFAGLRSLLSH